MAHSNFLKLNHWSVSTTLPRLREPHTISIDGLVSESICSGHPSQPLWHRTSSSIGLSVLQTLDFPWTWPWSSVAWLSGWSGVITNSKCRRIGLFLFSFCLVREIFHQTFHSLERIQSYLDIDHEPKATEAGRPPAAWPNSGELKVDGLSARYSAVSWIFFVLEITTNRCRLIDRLARRCSMTFLSTSRPANG